MINRNTVIIESNAYAKRNEYYWKNVNGALEDLSENTVSYFSKTKPQYKRLKESVISDVAEELVREMKVYESSNGLCIEVNGTLEDFRCISEVVENSYSSEDVECRFGSRQLNSAADVIPEIKEIYSKLKFIILKYSNEEQSTFYQELMGESDVSMLYEKCRHADNNLGEILGVVKEKADSLSKTREKSFMEYHKKGEEKIKEAIAFLKPQICQLCESEKKRLENEYNGVEKEIKKYFTQEIIIKRDENVKKIKRTVNWKNLAGLYEKKIATEERISQYINKDIDTLKKKIDRFWRDGIASLKRKISALIRNYDQIDEWQKRRICRCIAEYEISDEFNEILLKYYEKKFDIKGLTVKNAEKSYERELDNILKNAKKFIISKDYNSAFENWRSGLIERMIKVAETSEMPEMSAEQEKDEEANRLILLAEEEKRRRNHQEKLQAGKEKLEKLISFREV